MPCTDDYFLISSNQFPLFLEDVTLQMLVNAFYGKGHALVGATQEPSFEEDKFTCTYLSMISSMVHTLPVGSYIMCVNRQGVLIRIISEQLRKVQTNEQLWLVDTDIGKVCSYIWRGNFERTSDYYSV